MVAFFAITTINILTGRKPISKMSLLLKIIIQYGIERYNDLYLYIFRITCTN